MTRVACTDPNSANVTTYYANGQTGRTSGGTWYFPNGQTARTSGGTMYYPNGQTAKTGGNTWYYPNGQTAWTASGTWYYPNGQVAGGYDAVVGWAKSRVTAQQNATYAHVMQSDVEAFRMFMTIRLLTQVR